MTSYHVVPAIRAARRPYSITLGLAPGYSPAGEEAHPRQVWVDRERAAVAVALNWMAARAVQGRPYLTGLFTQGTMAYAWPAGPAFAETCAEPSLAFTGCTSPEHHVGLDDDAIRVMLNELATAMGSALDQTRVYVSYLDEIWILEADGKTTPHLAAVR